MTRNSGNGNRKLNGGTAEGDTILTAKQTRTAPASLPWWRRGGMHVNNAGGGVITVVPVLLLASHLPYDERCVFATLLLVSYASAAAIGCRTIYCVFALPTYMMSILLCLRWEGVAGLHPALIIAASIALAVTKVNICMSVCLHRYASHAAFRCGPCTRVALLFLGCLANQGGPIWWASQHRCHHKYCDMSRDPHSPTVSGIEAAFTFFERREAVEEEFAPRHLESTWMRLMDTWSWCAVASEMLVAHALFGRDGLFVAFTSGWISQAVTLWFNIANHPPKVTDRNCKATDVKEPLHSYYLPFHILDLLYSLFGTFVAEGEHRHHHDHPGLAKRKLSDLAYWTFIAPLEVLGIVWDVNK